MEFICKKFQVVFFPYGYILFHVLYIVQNTLTQEFSQLTYCPHFTSEKDK